MKTLKSGFFLLLLIIGCSKTDTSHQMSEYTQETDNLNIHELNNLKIYSTNTEPVSTIRFVRKESYGSSADNLITVGGSYGNAVVVDETGRVFIPDRQQFTIHVFQPDGSFVTSMGQKGRGPGEFLSLGSMEIDSNNIYVFDSLQLRIIAFSLDFLAYSFMVNLDPGNWNQIVELRTKGPSDYFIRRNGNFFVKFRPSIQYIENLEGKDYTLSYYFINSRGKFVSDKIFWQTGRSYEFVTLNGSRFSVTLPFMGRSLITLSKKHIYSAWNKNFLIKVYSSNGQYLRAFYYPFKRSKLHRDNVVKMYDMGYKTPNLKYIQNTDLPETWPALNSMFFDDEGHLWVSTIINDSEVYEWWILRKTGELITKFEWPRNEPIEEVRNGYMYTRETDKKTGLQRIVKYRIEME